MREHKHSSEEFLVGDRSSVLEFKVLSGVIRGTYSTYRKVKLVYQNFELIPRGSGYILDREDGSKLCFSGYEFRSNNRPWLLLAPVRTICLCGADEYRDGGTFSVFCRDLGNFMDAIDHLNSYYANRDKRCGWDSIMFSSH